MNRRKLARRTTLARRIAAKWDIHRAFIAAYVEMYSKPSAWSLLGTDGLKPEDFDHVSRADGGAQIRDTITYHGESPLWDKLREHIQRGNVLIPVHTPIAQTGEPDDRIDSLMLAMSVARRDQKGD